MVTLESTFTVLVAHLHHPYPNSNSNISSNNNNYYCLFPKPSPQTINLRARVSGSVPSTSKAKRHGFQLLCSAFHLQEVPLPTVPDHTTNVKKLYVCNLPWSLSPADIKSLFSQCGTVTDVEIIKNKDGAMTGFAFVTMASGEEAQAAIHKFHSHEIAGRTIKVELAKRFKKPRPPGPPAGETRHKIYASNLAWKVRSSHLREFFSEKFKEPVSARVVFDSSSGRCAGFGFVSFVTKEEAEDAISALDGKELMGRPVCLKFSRKTIEEAGGDKADVQGYDDRLEEAGSDKEEEEGYDDQLELS